MLLGVDVGGTFTDAVLVAEGRGPFTAKVPTTPSAQSEGVLEAVRLVLAAAGAQPREVDRFAHGMTVATNALLEGNTARTALIATAGFEDVIELARQNRPHLYRLCQAAPPPLVPAELRFGARERIAPDGILRALDPAHAREVSAQLAQSEPQAVAVCLLHSYADPVHEQLLGAEIRELRPDVALSLSSELVGTFREYERTATTALDASLSPLLSSYLGRLSREARADGLPEPQVMQSSGGLTDSGRAGAHAALTVLSGPAGGVGGASLLAELAGERHVLCVDMGGTSCDVCLISDGDVGETAERLIGGRPLALPALDIQTVGAGGGSIAWRDAGGALRVGPTSAGAVPGPACYGLGGEEPTVTDANLVLGRLLEDSPLAGGVRLRRGAAECALSGLASELDLELLELAEGVVRVAEAEMLGALRLVTIERGIDPRGLVLLPFGGAGPLHATALAERLGISRLLCPRASGVLSALGLAAAAPRRDQARSVLLRGEALTHGRLQQEREALLERARAQLGSPPVRARVRHELRYAGQSFELAVDEELPLGQDASEAGHPAAGSPAAGHPPAGLGPEQLRAAFAGEHERRYGYSDPSGELELVTMRISVWGPAPELRPAAAAAASPVPETRGIVFGGEWVSSQVFRGEPAPGTPIAGPALWALPEATLLVPPGWRGRVDGFGSLLLERERGDAAEVGGR
ncbi:MAG TPA: hydantoinase/oxoprolinase family protein [Solirubrobacteraceae bacterium]|nr:hydantoinase/oxoprolinase family protein [Solirubrobacteraceae bacterium]